MDSYCLMLMATVISILCPFEYFFLHFASPSILSVEFVNFICHFQLQFFRVFYPSLLWDDGSHLVMLLYLLVGAFIYILHFRTSSYPFVDNWGYLWFPICMILTYHGYFYPQRLTRVGHTGTHIVPDNFFWTLLGHILDIFLNLYLNAYYIFLVST